MKTFYSCLFRANLFSRKFYERKANGEHIIIALIMAKFMMDICILIMDSGILSVLNSIDKYFASNNAGTLYECSFAAQEQCGWLPSWSSRRNWRDVGQSFHFIAGRCMGKRIRTFDPEKALKAYAHEAMNKGPGRCQRTWFLERIF